MSRSDALVIAQIPSLTLLFTVSCRSRPFRRRFRQFFVLMSRNIFGRPFGVYIFEMSKSSSAKNFQWLTPPLGQTPAFTLEPGATLADLVEKAKKKFDAVGLQMVTNSEINIVNSQEKEAQDAVIIRPPNGVSWSVTHRVSSVSSSTRP